MKKGLSDSERIAEGQILARIILEILGSPKEHIEKALKDYVLNLKTSNDYEIIKEYHAEPEEQKDNLFSTYTELEIWFEDAESLVSFCFDSLPSSIEILEPEEFRFKSNKFAGLLNDLQARLHKLDAILKKHITDQTAAGERFKTVINNFMVFCIKNGKNSLKEITEVTGIEEKKAEKWLSEMVDKKIINKKDSTYSI